MLSTMTMVTSGYRTTAAEGGIMGTRARRAMGGIMNRVDTETSIFSRWYR